LFFLTSFIGDTKLFSFNRSCMDRNKHTNFFFFFVRIHFNEIQNEKVCYSMSHLFLSRSFLPYCIEYTIYMYLPFYLLVCNRYFRLLFIFSLLSLLSMDFSLHVHSYKVNVFRIQTYEMPNSNPNINGIFENRFLC
jgi:hypothetical protein